VQKSVVHEVYFTQRESKEEGKKN